MASVKVISSIPKVAKNIPFFDGYLHIELNLNGINRFNRQYAEAQRWLDEAVLDDCSPFVPMLNGPLYKSGISNTTPGEGIVQWGTPYGKYIYYGNVMVDAATGKGPMHYVDRFGNEVIRFRKGAKLRPTSEKLKINKSTHPLATSFWFEAAKTRHDKRWIRGTQHRAGGG